MLHPRFKEIQTSQSDVGKMVHGVANKVACSCTYVMVRISMTFCLFFLHLRMVTFSNNVEPANGFLVRYLHRKMMESEDEKNLTNEDLIRVLDWVPKLWYHLHAFLEKHSTSDFLIGMKHTPLRTGHEESYVFIL